MRWVTRFAVGSTLGISVLAVYFYSIDIESVLERAAAVTPVVVGFVVVLVVLEGLADSIGVWASVRPLGRGLSARKSVQFALAGDFFDILSPAGPVSSEPIMARFISVATGTGYSDALGVRTVAKYVKSGAQLTVSVTLGIIVLFGTPQTDALLITLIAAVGGLLLVGITLVRLRGYVSSALVVVLTPVVRWISSLYREDPHDRSVVVAAVERFWTRILDFRGAPRLLVLVRNESFSPDWRKGGQL